MAWFGKHQAILSSRFALLAAMTAILAIGPWVLPPVLDLPVPLDVGAILGTLLAAQGAIAALTLAVSLFMKQGIRARREVDDRIFLEYVKRSWIRDIFWAASWPLGVTGVLLLSQGSLVQGECPGLTPHLRYFVPAAGLAFLLNLSLAGYCSRGLFSIRSRHDGDPAMNV